MLQRCCCMNLITGAIVLGSVGLFFSTIGFISSCCGLRNIDNVIHQYLVQSGKSEKGPYSAATRNIAYIVTSISLVFFLCYLISCILLILGAVKRIAIYLVPWLLIAVFSLVLHILYYVSIFFLNIFSGAGLAATIGYVIIGVISFAVHLYFAYAMYSLYYYLKEGEDMDE